MRGQYIWSVSTVVVDDPRRHPAMGVTNARHKGRPNRRGSETTKEDVSADVTLPTDEAKWAT